MMTTHDAKVLQGLQRLLTGREFEGYIKGKIYELQNSMSQPAMLQTVQQNISKLQSFEAILQDIEERKLANERKTQE